MLFNLETVLLTARLVDIANANMSLILEDVGLTIWLTEAYSLGRISRKLQSHLEQIRAPPQGLPETTCDFVT